MKFIREKLGIFYDYLWGLFLISLVGYCTYNGTREDPKKKLDLIPNEQNILKWEQKKRSVLNNWICDFMDSDLKQAKERQFYECTGSSYAGILSISKIGINLSLDLHDIPKEYRSLNDINPLLEEISCRNNIEKKWRNCPTSYTPEYKNK